MEITMVQGDKSNHASNFHTAVCMHVLTSHWLKLVPELSPRTIGTVVFSYTDIIERSSTRSECS
jgi:hypothetical protein